MWTNQSCSKEACEERNQKNTIAQAGKRLQVANVYRLKLVIVLSESFYLLYHLLKVQKDTLVLGALFNYIPNVSRHYCTLSIAHLLSKSHLVCLLLNETRLSWGRKKKRENKKVVSLRSSA